MNTGCILLAAGAGVRFGGDKLKAPVAGRPLAEYVLSNLPAQCFQSCVMVAADAELLHMAAKHDISGVINDKPEEGAARSIRMGLQAIGPVDACMFCVCDQPLLTRETIRGMLESYVPGTILALSCSGKRGNPVLFPSSLLDELSALKPDESGKNVINAHRGLLRLYTISDPAQLMDADTRQQLAELENIILKRRLP